MRVRLGELRDLVRRVVCESDETGTFETPRMVVDYVVKGGQRMFITARLKSPDWLEKVVEKPAVEQTVDFNGDEAYLNRMDANFKGKGYGPEVMTAVLKFLKERGFATARGYIEHTNFASQRMMKKVGAVEQDQKEHGSYWVVDLRRV